MRKRLLFIALSFFISFSLFSQTEVNQQYEIIPWKPVEKAKKYEVEIERFDADSGEWAEYSKEQTKETQVEILFSPGEYRARISTFNLLGKKKSTSDWKKFKILEEHIPYVFSNYFQKCEEWNSPVLFLNRTNLDLSKIPESEKFIQPPQGYSEKTLFVKGKNIFSPKTEFYLVPETDSTAGGKTYNAYNETRKEQKLTLVKRDSVNNGVYVTYEPSKLESGYYLLEARNPGAKASTEILVLAEEELTFKPEKYIEDKRYSVNALEIQNSQSTVQFKALGKELSSSAEYVLEPSEGFYSYPFEATFGKEKLELSHSLVSCSKDEAHLQFDVSSPQLKTGYYKLSAKSYTGLQDEFIVLVKKDFDKDLPFDIDKVSSKFNKRSQTVDFTLKGKEINTNAVYTLISEYEEYKDSNERVALNFVQGSSADKYTASVPLSQMTDGKQALMIEMNDKCYIQYFEMDKHLKIHKLNLTDEQVANTFLRPEKLDVEIKNTISDQEAVVYEDADVEIKMELPKLFSRVNFMAVMNTAEMKQNFKPQFNIGLDIFNNGWVSLGTGVIIKKTTFEVDNAPIMGTVLSGDYVVESYDVYLQASATLGIKRDLFSAYLSMNYGYGVFTNGNFITYYAANNLLSDNKMYLQAGLGFKLLNYVDMGVCLSRTFKLDSQFEWSWISSYKKDVFGNYNKNYDLDFFIGFNFPIRMPVINRKVLTQKAVITKSGPVDGRNYTDLRPNTVEIELRHGATEVSGFENRTEIKKITIPSSVNTIDKDAFAGWTSGQTIETAVDYSNNGENEVEWAENTKAAIISNDVLYCTDRMNPLENPNNYSITYSDAGLIYKRETVDYKGNYYAGLKLDISDVGLLILKYTWFGVVSPDPLIAELKKGNTLSFKTIGDGGKYIVHIETEGAGRFEYVFKTKKGKVKQITLPYDKIKPIDLSSEKILDINTIEYMNIIPDGNSKNPEMTIFDIKVE